MKNLLKNKLLYILIITFIILSAFQICMASDLSLVSENEANTETNSIADNSEEQQTYEFIASDLYKFDTDISINQVIDGNVFAFGDNVTISGEIGGDVFVFADTVNFTNTAYIHGSIFAFAKTMTMDGLAYDIYGAAGDFTLGKDSIIARDIKIAAGNTYINGNVKRNAYIATDNLTLAEGAKDLISGNLNYFSANEISIPDGAVAGHVTFNPFKAEKNVNMMIISYVNKVFSAVLYTLIITLLAIWLAPKFVNKAPYILKKNAPLSFGIGLLSSIILIFVPFFFMFLTYGLGAGTSVAVFAIFILALTISKTIFSIATAKLLASKFKWEKPYLFVLATLLVTLVVSILEIIPFLGGFVGFAISMIGFGILVLSLISKKNFEEDTTKVEVIK